MKLAFIADEITSFKKNHDSTWAIMQEAFNQKDKIFYAHASSLSIKNCQAHGEFIFLDEEFFSFQKSHKAKLIKFPVSAFDEDPNLQKYPCKSLNLDEFDLIFMRKDPPVDNFYIQELQILELCKKALVVNSPQALLRFNEKLSIMHFPDCIAPTLVSDNILEIKNFIKEHKKVVIKPLSGKGGEGIFIIEEGGPNLNVILETALDAYYQPLHKKLIMVQKFIDDINKQGDKRLILIKGKVQGALLRIPQAGDHRGNFAAGASFKQYQPNKIDLEICKKLEGFLVENKIYLAGIDIIGDYLTEINITSPTCLQEINQLNGGKKLESILLEELKKDN